MSQSILSAPVPSTGPRPGENTWLWLIKIITGPLLVILLGLHLTVNHYLGSLPSGLMTHQDVVAYFKNPIIPAVEILFLATVVTHSLIGLRGIILDLNPSRPALRIVDWFLVIFGVSAVGYGVWLALRIASLGS